MKKILLLDPGDFLGGAELCAIDIANELSRDPDLSVNLATTGHSDYREKLAPQVRFWPWRTERLKTFHPVAIWRLVRSVLDLARIARASEAEILISNSTRAHILASLWTMVSGKKLIWHLHDFAFPPILARFLGGIPRYIICNSEAVQRDFILKTKHKCVDKLRVIPNSLDADRLHLRAKTAIENGQLNLKKIHRLSDRTRLIGLVGRFDWWKGQKEFVLAAQELLAEAGSTAADYHFFLIGAPNDHDKQTVKYAAAVRAVADCSPWRKQIHFLGQQEEVGALISQLDLLVHASIAPEPLGRVILEGMALGVPVLAADQGGPSEIIKDGEDGFLWSPPDWRRLATGMKRALKCSYLEAIKSRAKDKVRSRYSWRTIGPQIKALF